MHGQKHEGEDVPVPPVSTPRESVEAIRREAEQAEVAERHDNSGQKDHKGAR